MSPEKEIIIFEHVFLLMTQNYDLCSLMLQIFLVIMPVTMVPIVRPPEFEDDLSPSVTGKAKICGVIPPF